MTIGANTAVSTAEYGIVAMFTVSRVVNLRPGDNPERMCSERSYAALCAISPVEASCGRTERHRLNRGGDRQANAACGPSS